MNSSAALDVSGMSKRYGATVALDDVSFTVGRGEVHALLGENGAGKSTLVKILSGIVSPDEGAIHVAGQPQRLRSSRDALSAGLATAFQELNMVPELTVAQNLMLGREPRNRLGLASNDAMAAAARELCAEWGLEGIDPDAEVHTLSLAVRQQLELVRTLSRETAVLLLDEPTAALGQVQVEWLFRQLDRVRERGGTIVFISHRMTEVREICDQATVLRNGRHVKTFPTAEASDDQVVELMLGHSAEQIWASAAAPAEIGDPVIEVSNLSSGDALRDVSFTLRSGEVLGIAALQGHGQYELFMSLFGVHRVSGGSIESEGKRVRLRSPRQAMRRGIGISMVPEDRKAEGVMLEMSGVANATLPSIGSYARLGFLNKRAERQAATRIMQEMRIQLAALDDDVSSLSGGNQQKLSIGKWLLTDHRVLLLYDPTRGVDVGTKTEIFETMHSMTREGQSILFYSTEIEELLAVSTRVLVLYRGEVVSELSGEGCTRSAVLGAMLGSGDAGSQAGPRGTVAE